MCGRECGHKCGDMGECTTQTFDLSIVFRVSLHIFVSSLILPNNKVAEMSKKSIRIKLRTYTHVPYLHHINRPKKHLSVFPHFTATYISDLVFIHNSNFAVNDCE